ncbi:hypothetical protein CEP51_003125 [Fusarium floridanum]|uniref:Uncharacterized protein n=1 Tax=Fusarium floridanum TaxID=1325733 RepID=A0A428S7S3_9HYPO|nr:hypothetical protein CEP51_003125 [Fusarium floridanum]
MLSSSLLYKPLVDNTRGYKRTSTIRDIPRSRREEDTLRLQFRENVRRLTPISLTRYNGSRELQGIACLTLSNLGDYMVFSDLFCYRPRLVCYLRGLDNLGQSIVVDFGWIGRSEGVPAGAWRPTFMGHDYTKGK